MVQYNQPGVQYNQGRYNAETITAVCAAQLGGMVAVVAGDITPAPSSPNPYLIPRQKRRKKVPQPVAQVETVIVPAPSTVKAYCVPVTASVVAFASGGVTFSAEEDDLQVLLML